MSDYDRREYDEHVAQLIERTDRLIEHGSDNFNRYRRRAYAGFLLLAVATAAALWLSNHALNEQKVGRSRTLSVVCGSISAVAEAGRATIDGGATGVGPSEFERNLRRLGYPPRSTRRRTAKAAARAYTRAIGRAVEQESGVTGIVRQDGSLDCAKLRRVGGVDQ